MSAAVRPTGRPTRGTTAPRRLRRLDRWLVAAHPQVLHRPDLLVVDLGFGARAVTTVELAHRLRVLAPQVRVVGLEIEPARVAAAQRLRAAGLEFGAGGFELAGLRPHVVRAANVLRQYDEADVQEAWTLMCSRLAPGGIVVDATCDETGRVGAWVTLDGGGPVSLTLALRRDAAPSAVAARLPKVLIHRNVAGERVHRLLEDLDEGWRRHAGLAVLGPRQRTAAAVAELRTAGWPLLDGPSRWRRGELTVAWPAVAPRATVPDRASPGALG